MSSALPAAPEGARVLIGAALDAHELREFVERPEVQVEAQPEALARLCGQHTFAVTLVDAELPRLTGDLLKRMSTQAGSGTPLVVLGHDKVVEVARQLAHALSEGPAAWEAALRWFVPSVRAGRPGPDPKVVRSRLVRPRSAAEAEAVKRRAVERAFEDRRRLLKGSFSATEVAKLLGVSRQSAHERVKGKSLLAIVEAGVLRFPPWQFDADGPGGIVEGLPQVLRVLKVGPVAQARWLTRPHRLFEGRSPLDALKAGELAAVVEEAEGVGAAAGHG